MTAAGLPLFVESSQIQSDHFLHAPRQSSSISTSSHISSQVPSAFDAQVTSGIVTPDLNYDSHDLEPPVSMTILPHLNQTAVPAHDMVANTLSLEDHGKHDPWHDPDKL
jgi:hypothetical protein